MNDDVWRHLVVEQLIGLRKTLYHLALILCAISGAAAFHLGAILVAAVAAAGCGIAVFGLYEQTQREQGEHQRFLRE